MSEAYRGGDASKLGPPPRGPSAVLPGEPKRPSQPSESGRVQSPVEINEDGESLWPRVDYKTRPLHGVAFLDPEFTDGTYTVRYVGINEADARAFAAERSGVYVFAQEATTVERDAWEVRP